MNLLVAPLFSFALVLGAPNGMQPRVLSNDTSHCLGIVVRESHIVLEESCTRRKSGPPNTSKGAEVAWDGHTATITPADEKASAEWIRNHSVLGHLSVKKGNLYWDGKKVDLGKVTVTRAYQAISWQNGVLVEGQTVPRKGFFQSWPFKGPFISIREIDPYCVIFFDTATLKGEDAWLGKVPFGLFVYPIPE
ncbi:MAG TPA: hypothetical protein VF532_20325 [Candidatus Angelobacter sp.]